ncbi:hypothetical protein DL89DRAFT_289971 [Linderina pennispora]|uniref:Mif2/CENP-C cupin domain-containing protein n=1 Tax=Linderina pennispora TaxID=61395 RepID=A0A1Y1WM14_9FUNG|nr:uncharacterized protein DL89DRAFT_289971 [Linderina pennispora]ORX74405.1 hypothetical protein DL89DRAFT_289971 [Linderina pennispora]
MDGLENVDAFFARTSPPRPQATPRARTSMQALQNMGRTPEPQARANGLDTVEEESDQNTEMTVESPTVTTRRNANRRATMVTSSSDLGWMREARKGRRATMAMASVREAMTPMRRSPRTPSEQEDATQVNGSDEDEPEFAAEQAGDYRIEESEEQVEEAEQDYEEVEPMADQEFDQEFDQGVRPGLDQEADPEADQGFGSDLDTQVEHTEPPIPDTPEPELPQDPATPKRRGRPRKPDSKPAKNGQALSQEKATRRSSRTSVQPLAFWRNEHIEYGYEQTESGAHVPKVKNIVRQTSHCPVCAESPRGELDLNDRNKFYYYDDENYGFPVSSDRTCKFGPRASKHTASVGQKRVRDEDDDNDDIAFKQQLCQQEVALARNSVEWVQMNDSRDKYRVAVGLYAEYSNGDVYANSGVLALPVGGAKPVRQSYERTMFYLVTAGKVEVTIRDAVMQVGILGQFIVPSGNSYGIKNIGTHPAQLYFVQIGVDDAAANGGAKIKDVQEEEAPEEDEGEETEEADVGHFSDVSEEL